MPVDLSMVGLKGIEAGQNTLNAIANREALQTQTAIEQGKFDREEADLELDRLAVGKVKSAMRGEGIDIDSGNVKDTDMASFMIRTGAEVAAAGGLKRGGDLVAAGLELQKKKADIAKTELETDKTQVELVTKVSDYVAEGIADVRNDSELQFFWDNLDPTIAEAIGPQKLEIMKRVPYSPDWIAMMRDQALSAKDAAQLDFQARSQSRADQVQADAKAYREASHDLAERRFAAAEAERKAKEKAGGTNIGSPIKNDERTTAEAAIRNTLGDKIPFNKQALFAATEDVVGEARRIVADSPGLTFPEAIQRAVMTSVAAGELGHLEEEETDVDGDGTTETVTTRRYKARGRTEDNPLSMPTGDMKAVQSKLIKGRYYNTPMGPLKWNGSTFD